MRVTTNTPLAPSCQSDPKVLQVGILAFRPVHNGAGELVDLVCTQVNEEAATILHKNAADILRCSITEIHPEDLETTIFRNYAKVVDTGEPLKIETEYIHDGQPLFWSVTAKREAEDLVLSISDISEQQRHASLLEERDRLQATGGFVRLVGHEVRNPLNNIVLALEGLEADDGFTPDQLKYLRMVRRNVERIDLLVRELLHTSRELNVVMVPGPLEAVLSAAMANVADRCELYGAKCTLEVDPGLEQVPMEGNALTLAFTNLLVNALEAIEPGKGELHVRATRSENRVQVTVTDNGKGMSEEDLSNITRPFFSSRKGGLGFGLTEARNIFNAHGMLLYVQSELGRGTSFTLLFPPTVAASVPFTPFRHTFTPWSAHAHPKLAATPRFAQSSSPVPSASVSRPE